MQEEKSKEEATGINTKSKIDRFHRIITGQPITPLELRIAGVVFFVWFTMDVMQWLDWLWGKFH